MHHHTVLSKDAKNQYIRHLKVKFTIWNELLEQGNYDWKIFSGNKNDIQAAWPPYAVVIWEMTNGDIPVVSRLLKSFCSMQLRALTFKKEKEKKYQVFQSS